MRACLSLALLLLGFSFASPSSGRDVLEPTDDAPQFRISNLRLTRGRFGRPNLTAEFTRIREGKGYVQLAAKTRGGPLMITSFGGNKYNQQSGTIELRLEDSGSGSGGYDYELYFVVPAIWVDHNYGGMLVSNTVRIGNPGPVTTARPWNADERSAFELNKKKDTPPTKPSDGYEFVTADAQLAPGMPIQVGYYSMWRDAEYLGDAGSGKVSVRFVDKDTATTVERENWLAATPENLTLAASTPSSFTPTIRVLPGGTHALPSHLIAIPDGVRLPRGAPLYVHWGSSWEVRHVVKDFGSMLKVLDPSTRDFFGKSRNSNVESHAEQKKRNELAIDRQTLQTLDDPAAVEQFAGNLIPKSAPFNDDNDAESTARRVLNDALDKHFGRSRDNELAGYHVIDRDYPIEITIPKRAVRLPEDVTLPTGTLVAYNWGRSWKAVNIVRDDGDTVVVHEADSRTVFAYRIDRDQLIVQTKTLATLKREAAKNAAALLEETRTWTDATGRFKVEARFVKKVGDKVTIQTDAGREITLPMAKLSADDRELLAGVADEAENPFAE